MATGKTFKIGLIKDSIRTLGEEVVKKQVADVMDTVMTKQRRNRGWSIDVETVEAWSDDRDNMHSIYSRRALTDRDTDRDGNNYRNSLNLLLTFSPPVAGAEPLPGELDRFLAAIRKLAAAEKRGQWKLVELDGEDYVPGSGSGEGKTGDVSYIDPVIPSHSVFVGHFTDLYGLDPQIAMIWGALQAGKASNYRHRLHCALQGPPGCGKSQSLINMESALEPGSCIHFDATATTQAGLIDVLTGGDTLPRLLLVEEIEKADPDSLRILLSILDLRGEIRKTTARDKILQSTRMLAFATVNDWALFNRIASGALASRFSTPIRYPRPTRATLERILRREIATVEDGDERWIKPALDFCFQTMPEINRLDTGDPGPPITDPRRVLSICLGGRNELLGRGRYLEYLRETMIPEDAAVRAA